MARSFDSSSTESAGSTTATSVDISQEQKKPSMKNRLRSVVSKVQATGAVKTGRVKKKASTKRTTSTRAGSVAKRNANTNVEGSAASTTPSLAGLIEVLKGHNIAVYEHGEEEYQIAIKQANAMYKYRQAGCVVQPRTQNDVKLVVQHAKKLDIPITVKNGGHSFCASSFPSSGVLLDLKLMNKVLIDMKTLSATVQAGAKWGNVYKELSLLKPASNGYLANGGRCAAVGVSGFVLGGGIGPWTRSLGMGCDTVINMTVVTANGTTVLVSEDNDPKTPEGELFWALCGAGHGNFGIVVELTLRISKISNPDKMVGSSLYTWYPQQGPRPLPLQRFELLKIMRRFYTNNWSRKITIDSTWLVDHRVRPELAIRWTTYFDGNRPEFEAQIDTGFKPGSPLANTLKSATKFSSTTMYYHDIGVQQEREESSDWTPDKSIYSLYESFIPTKDEKRLEDLRKIIYRQLTNFKENHNGQKVMASCSFIHTGGKASGETNNKTSFRWRETDFHFYIIVRWESIYLSDLMKEFFDNFRALLRPFCATWYAPASFYNFPNSSVDDAAFKDHEKIYFGDNKAKLQRVKKHWDEDDYFHWEQGVRLPNASIETPLGNEEREEQEFKHFQTSSMANYVGQFGTPYHAF